MTDLVLLPRDGDRATVALIPSLDNNHSFHCGLSPSL
jgi:hypothetical protein